MSDSSYRHKFESYGVVCEVSSNDDALLSDAMTVADRSLLGKWNSTRKRSVVTIDLQRTSRSYYTISRDGERLASGRSRKKFLKFFDSIVRVTIGEHAPNHIFIHAGAVAWKGVGIVLPADSFKGKSTLVAELVAAGATYYSDDFAIIDNSGLLVPFARDISMRSKDGKYRTYEIGLQDSDYDIGHDPVKIGIIYFTVYRRGSGIRARMMTRGECLMELIKYSLNFRRSPDRTLVKLNEMLSQTKVSMIGLRGSAEKTVKYLFDLVDKTTF